MQPIQPPKPNYSYISKNSNYKPFGDCGQGSFLQPYVPTNPYNTGEPGKPLKAIIYLHGFAFGSPQIYEAHLQHLVKQGFFVFFPNFQHGLCHFDPDQKIEDFLKLTGELMQGLSDTPEEWIKSAIKSTFNAYNEIKIDKSQQSIPLIDLEVDTYIFGHSFGGLLALCWPYYLNQFAEELKISVEQKEKLEPKQIVVANPVPDSRSTIPKFVEVFISGTNFYQHPIILTQKPEIGQALQIPVAILHGDSDQFISKENWIKPFATIQSQDKAFFYSQTDKFGNPHLIADHNQSVNDTSFVTDAIAKDLGGLGRENNLSWRYIWYALDQAICGAKVDDLHFDLLDWIDDKTGESIQSVKPIVKCMSHEMFEEFKTLTESIAVAGVWSPNNIPDNLDS